MIGCTYRPDHTSSTVQINISQEKSESPTTIRAEVPIGSFVSVADAARNPLIAFPSPVHAFTVG